MYQACIAKVQLRKTLEETSSADEGKARKARKTVCVPAELSAKSDISICNCHWDTPCARFE